MANTLTPMVTELVPSGKTLTASSQLTFDLGTPSSDRRPLLDFLTEDLAFSQMIPFVLDIEADQTLVNLWEAPTDVLRARAVIVTCLAGAGGILVNGSIEMLPFPLEVGGWFLYVNPLGEGLTVDVDGSPTDTGPGIQNVTVSTGAEESRFQGYVFV